MVQTSGNRGSRTRKPFTSEDLQYEQEEGKEAVEQAAGMRLDPDEGNDPEEEGSAGRRPARPVGWGDEAEQEEDRYLDEGNDPEEEGSAGRRPARPLHA